MGRFLGLGGSQIRKGSLGFPTLSRSCHHGDSRGAAGAHRVAQPPSGPDISSSRRAPQAHQRAAYRPVPDPPTDVASFRVGPPEGEPHEDVGYYGLGDP
jgi:hypothetical protein